MEHAADAAAGVAWHGTARAGGGVPVGVAHMHAHVRSQRIGRSAGHPGGQRTVRARAFSSGGITCAEAASGRRPVAIGAGEGTCAGVRRPHHAPAFLLRGPAADRGGQQAGSREACRRADSPAGRPCPATAARGAPRAVASTAATCRRRLILGRVVRELMPCRPARPTLPARGAGRRYFLRCLCFHAMTGGVHRCTGDHSRVRSSVSRLHDSKIPRL